MATNIHIGRKIKAQVEKRGMKVTELAKRINKTSQAIYHIYKSASIDTKVLQEISDAMEFNFFQYYVKKGKDESFGKNSRRISILIDVDDADQAKLLKTLGVSLK